jgi:hypothetical protein
MKNSFLHKKLKVTSIKAFAFSFLVAFLMMATNSFALDIDNSATATAVSVPDTIKMGTDLYAAHMSHASAVVDDTQIDVAQAGDWFWYKITSVSGGTFNAIISMATKNTTGKVNVSLYTTDSVMVDAGVTYGPYNNSWTSTIDYKYPLTLDAGVEYLMKVSQIDAGTNIKAISVAASTQSPDATLSTLTVGGVEVDGFNPAVYTYAYSAATTVAQVTVGATANNGSASVAGTGDIAVAEGDNALEVVVTAEDGSMLTYTVNVFNPYSSSIDATLSDLQIDSATISGFDPATYSYNVFLAPGAAADSVNIIAIANDVNAQGVAGTGNVAIAEGRTTLTVTVTSESGLTQDYTLNLITPIEVVGAKELAMLDDIVTVPSDKHPRVRAATINWWSHDEYIEYYVYAPKDEKIIFSVLAANADAGDSQLNVSTYEPDSIANWMLDTALTKIVPGGAGDWAVDYATNVDFEFDLKANVPVVVRLYCVVNSNRNSLANVYGLTLNAVDSLEMDKVRMVPTNLETEADSAASQFLFETHSTGTNGDISITNDALIESTRQGAWAEYQIMSPISGNFNAVIKMGTQKSGAKINVGVYKTETQGWSANGDTLDIVQGGWNDATAYYFPISLEGGVYYTMRINFISTTNNWVGNIHGLTVEKSGGNIDADLSDLTVDGTTIEGFSAGTATYSIVVPEGTSEITLDATPNDTLATVEGLGTVPLMEGMNSFEILVTAEDTAVTKTYTVNVKLPFVLVVPDTILMASYSIASHQISELNDHNVGNALGGMYDVDSTGVWIEYKVKALEAGTYTLLLTHGTPAANLAFNVDTYAPGDTFVLDSAKNYKVPASNVGSWKDKNHTYALPFYLEANDTTILRVSYIQVDTIIGNATLGNSWFMEVKKLDSLEMNKVRYVPTVAGADSTEFLFLTHSTGMNGTVQITNDSLIESNKRGAWVEYQIMSPVGGIFNTVIVAGTQKAGSQLNVGVYKTMSEEWMPNGDTLDIVQGGWNDENMYKFRLDLTAGVIYTMRINFLGGGSWIANIHDIYVEESLGSEDATLSDLTIGGVTVDGFTPESDTIAVTVPKGTIVLSLGATASDSRSSISGTGVKIVHSGLNYIDVVVTAENPNVTKTYTLAVTVSLVGVGINDVEANSLNIFGGNGKISVRCGDSYIGSKLDIYDISGKLVTSRFVDSSFSDINVSNSGLYIVRVSGANNAIETTKCFVK